MLWDHRTFNKWTDVVVSNHVGDHTHQFQDNSMMDRGEGTKSWHLTRLISKLALFWWGGGCRIRIVCFQLWFKITILNLSKHASWIIFGKLRSTLNTMSQRLGTWQGHNLFALAPDSKLIFQNGVCGLHMTINKLRYIWCKMRMCACHTVT